MRRHHLTILVILGMLVTGCPYNYKNDSILLTNTSVCCNDFSEIEYHPIAMNKKVSIPIQTKLPTYNFPEGKRFFRAFSLPPDVNPLQVTISNLITLEVIVKPKIILLDKQFKITRSFVMDDDKDWETGQYRKTIFINEQNQDESYVIIYPEVVDGKIVGKHEVHNTYMVGGYGLLAVPVIIHNSAVYEYVFSPTGDMNIEIKGYILKSADKQKN